MMLLLKFIFLLNIFLFRDTIILKLEQKI